ncbi:hypothetical protein BBJ28_00008531 [Nothophytophthora sp. Chile5]|nr:hypothetical protein BBJ28_00008531 [Nothophytophthora sp. Chile5]
MADAAVQSDLKKGAGANGGAPAGGVSSSSSSHAAGSRGDSSNGKSSSGSRDAERAAHEEARRRRAPPGSGASAEERAMYELERKKVAKYKEDKLKARRDHTRMILESHAQAKRRALLGKQSEFLATLEFRNALPDIPFDTKFVQYPHERERLIKYKPNTLEQDYTYEIHEEANLGLPIDLIDPAKYEGASPIFGFNTAKVWLLTDVIIAATALAIAPENPGPLEIGDEQVLMMKEDHAGKVGRSKARPTVSWLRRTEYMGNDLYDAVHKFKSEVEIQSALREGTENALAEVVSITLEDRAEASFRDINDPKLLVHPFQKKKKIAKMWDVFPDQVLSANKYAILSYDILPSEDIKSKGIENREDRAVLCGISKKIQAGNELIQGSILLPNAADDEVWMDTTYRLSSKDHDDREKFSYLREYLMSVESLESHCVFMLDPESNQFTYSDILNRIQLKKTKRHRGAIVHRREYSDAETERRTQLLFEYGGIYDESLDDEESVREFKRRRTGEKPESDEEETKTSTPPPGDSPEKASSPGNGSPVISDSDSE